MKLMDVLCLVSNYYAFEQNSRLAYRNQCWVKPEGNCLCPETVHLHLHCLKQKKKKIFLWAIAISCKFLHKTIKAFLFILTGYGDFHVM